MRASSVILVLASLGACGGEEEVTPIPPGTPGTEAPADPGAGAPVGEPAAAAAPALPPAPPMPTITLSPEDTARATTVAAQATGRSFPREVRDDKTLAPVFLYLAATAEDEDVLVSALNVLSSAWTVVPRQVEREYTMVTDDFVGVIAARIRDPRPRVQAAAIQGGALAFRGDDSNETLLDAYLALATPAQPAPLRYEVLNNVWQARRALGTPARIQPFLDALDATEPWLVSTALWRLESLVPRDASFGAAVRAKALAHTSHANPGVRGRAAGLLSTLAARMNDGEPERVAAAARFTEMMADENPFVKSAAMNAHRDLNTISAIHAMIPHLADATRNTYDIEGWQRLDGTRGRIHHDGSAWSQVRDAALYSIKALSRRHDRDGAFDYNIRGGQSAEDLDAAVAACNTWYTANRAGLPE